MRDGQESRVDCCHNATSSRKTPWITSAEAAGGCAHVADSGACLEHVGVEQVGDHALATGFVVDQ